MIESSFPSGFQHLPTSVPGDLGQDKGVGQLFLRAQSAETQAGMFAAIVELQSHLDSATTLSDAAQILTTHLQDYLPCDRVFVLWRKSDDRPLKIVAPIVTRSEQTMLVAAAEEVCVRGEVSTWPCADTSSREGMLAIAQHVKEENLTGVSIIPLNTPRRDGAGAVVIHHQSEQKLKSRTDYFGQFLDLVAEPISRKFDHLDLTQPRAWERWIRRIADPALKRKKQMLVVGLALFLAAMLMPVPYRVAANCELQPVERRYIAASFDGPLKEVSVRPGDYVYQGDTLARIDPREIELQLASLQAELSQATQDQKDKLASHDFGGSRIAELESERIQLQTELLKHQRDHMAITSPLDGVVVSGDLKTMIGTPLKRGETMFEVAPLGHMIVEISVHERNIEHVRKQMPVTFRLHAMPGKTLTGTIAHIHPKAELRDDDNVFIAEIQLRDEANVLRPGLKGRAWIRSDRQLLGWVLFHRAYYALQNGLGW